MKNNEVKLNWLKKWALKIAFGLVEFLIGSIKQKTARILLQAAFTPTKDIIDVVTDRVPDNKLQLKELFEQKGGIYVGELLDGVKELIQDAEKIDPQVKALIIDAIGALSQEVKEHL